MGILKGLLWVLLILYLFISKKDWTEVEKDRGSKELCCVLICLSVLYAFES